MTGASAGDEQTDPSGRRDWRLWAVLGVTAVVLIGGAIVWAVAEGKLASGKDAPRVITDERGWTATGSLVGDTDLVEDAAERLESETTPILLWAGEGRNGVNEVSELVAFAVPVDEPQFARAVVRVVVVDTSDSSSSPTVYAAPGSLDNVIVRLPVDEVDGTEANSIYLTREDVRSVADLDGNEVEVDDRLFGSSGSRFELRHEDGIGYTSTLLTAPLSADLWERETADDILQTLPSEGITTLGEPASVEFEQGTGVVVPLMEQRIRGRVPGTQELGHPSENAESTSQWAALVRLPEAMVDSAASGTILTPYAPTNQNVDALAVGYPYAVPANDERLGGRVLITTGGLTQRGGPNQADDAYGIFNAEPSSIRIEPELPTIADSESGVTSIVGFDTRTALVAWYGEDGGPVWSTVVRPAEAD